MDRFRRPTGREMSTDDDAPVTGRRRHRRAARAALALAVTGMIASVLALVPASPAHAVITNPVLFVGGHGNQNEQLEGWADYIDGALGLSDNLVRGVELRTEPGWNNPFDSPDYGDWPGTRSNELSAYDTASSADIYDAINSLYTAAGNKPVEVVAISQGALATRWLLQTNPNNIRSKVASYVSFGGVNAGIPDFFTPLDWCEDLEWLTVCEEIMWDTPIQQPGETDWIEQEVNQAEYTAGGPVTWGDPTPGTLPYFHIYTADDDGVTDVPDYSGQEIEALKPYGWAVPLLGASNRSAQDECGSTYVAPHGGWVGTTPDPVLEELLLDALHRRTLDAPASLC